MSSPLVELIWAAPGPGVDAARSALLAALPAAGLAPYWDEWQAGDRLRPAHLPRSVAGVALFVNQRPAWDDGRGWGDPRALAPAIAERARLPYRPRTREPFARRLRYTVLPAAGLALLPKCPLCWAAYAGVATSLGVAPLTSHRLLVLLFAVALVVSLAAVGLRSRRLADARPLLFAALGAATVLAGRFVWSSSALMLAGLGTLTAAAVWSSWPRRAATANPSAAQSSPPRLGWRRPAC